MLVWTPSAASDALIASRLSRRPRTIVKRWCASVEPARGSQHQFLAGERADVARSSGDECSAFHRNLERFWPENAGPVTWVKNTNVPRAARCDQWSARFPWGVLSLPRHCVAVSATWLSSASAGILATVGARPARSSKASCVQQIAQCVAAVRAGRPLVRVCFAGRRGETQPAPLSLSKRAPAEFGHAGTCDRFGAGNDRMPASGGRT
jgi:hypothetical protein